MKISAWWILPVLAIGIIAAWLFLKFVYDPREMASINKRKHFDIITFKLRNSNNWGPDWWKAKEFLNANLPCSLCSDEAVPLGSFEHDIVNGMIEKPIFPFDRANWKLWVNKINELDKKVV